MSESVSLMSPQWAEEYRNLWNSTPETRDGTKDLEMLIEFRVKDRTDRASQIDVKHGEAVYGGPPIQDRTPDFVLTATTENWRRVGSGETSPTTAITMRKIQFDGPLRVAMVHVGALNRGLRLVGEVAGLDWEA